MSTTIYSPVDGKIESIHLIDAVTKRIAIYIPRGSDHRIVAPVSGTVTSIALEQFEVPADDPEPTPERWQRRLGPPISRREDLEGVLRATPGKIARAIIVFNGTVELWLEIGEGWIVDRLRLQRSIRPGYIVRRGDLLGRLLGGSLATVTVRDLRLQVVKGVRRGWMTEKGYTALFEERTLDSRVKLIF